VPVVFFWGVAPTARRTDIGLARPMSAPVVGLQNQARLAGLGGGFFLHHREKISLTFLIGKKIGKHIYRLYRLYRLYIYDYI